MNTQDNKTIPNKTQDLQNDPSIAAEFTDLSFSLEGKLKSPDASEKIMLLEIDGARQNLEFKTARQVFEHLCSVEHFLEIMETLIVHSSSCDVKAKSDFWCVYVKINETLVDRDIRRHLADVSPLFDAERIAYADKPTLNDDFEAFPDVTYFYQDGITYNISDLSAVHVETIENATMCSGFGSHHTNGSLMPDGSKRPDVNRTPYVGITFEGIQALVDNPQTLKKDKAQWLVPSSYKGEYGRTHKYQRDNGQYWCLWADLDIDPPTIEKLDNELGFYLGCNYEIYTSRSATKDKQKSHINIPLDEPLSGLRWAMAQVCLNDWLEEQGIKPDRASERTGQITYLPNRGEFYASASSRDVEYFDPCEHFKEEMDAKFLAIGTYNTELIARKAASKIKKEQRLAIGVDSPVDEYNDLYQVEDVLIKYGYVQHELHLDRFMHPASGTGSFSATVRNNRVHAMSAEDPLCTMRAEGGSLGAHDAFSAFTVLAHNGDTKAAIKDAGDNILFVGDEHWNKVKQREYKEEESKVEPHDFLGDNKPDTINTDDLKTFDMSKFSLNGTSAAMRKDMQEHKYVLGEIAILGQLTALYAKPNGGKTLLTIYLLIEAIKKGNVKPDDVFYINADDNHTGLVEKLELAEKYGFNMVAPGFNGFNSAELGLSLNHLMENNEARGKVIILDTLKKFTNIMDKSLASKFGTMMREFVTKGGTIIMLAHTNKNRDSDGKVIFSGTSDIVDDVDCAYTLDVNDDKGGVLDKSVIFEKIKSRGANVQEAAYKFLAIAQSYDALLNSVTPIDEYQVKEAKARIVMDELLTTNNDAIDSILELLNEGVTSKTDLIGRGASLCGISTAKIRKVLKAHNGSSFIDGHRWQEYKGDKAAKLYRVIHLDDWLQ